jgi:hypothetical protein
MAHQAFQKLSIARAFGSPRSGQTNLMNRTRNPPSALEHQPSGQHFFVVVVEKISILSLSKKKPSIRSVAMVSKHEYAFVDTDRLNQPNKI